MAYSWFRVFHGTARDGKLHLVARKAGAHRTNAIAAWLYILEFASANDPRGSIEGLDIEVMGLDLDLDPELVERLLGAMREKGMFDGNLVAAWEKRQARGEDTTNAERQRRYRERQRQERERARAEGGEDAPPTVTRNGVTAGRNGVTALDSDLDRDSEIDDSSPPGGGESSPGSRPTTSAPTAQEIATAVDLYNATAERLGLPKAQKITDARRKKLAARLRDAGGLPGWEAALEALSASRFLTGRTDSSFRADLDFLCQERSFTRLMEGAYADRGGASRSSPSPVMDAFDALAARVAKRAPA